MDKLRSFGKALVSPSWTNLELLALVSWLELCRIFNANGEWYWLVALAVLFGLGIVAGGYKELHWVVKPKWSYEYALQSAKLAGMAEALTDRNNWTCVDCKKACGIAPKDYRSARPVSE